MVSICREMGILLMKTSYSTIFNEGLDFTCALADAKGDMIACAEFCPTMIGGMPLLIKTCAQEIPFETLEEGDVILHNDPYRGGLHCPEHTFFKPFFVDGELLGFAVCIGHIAEIGGMVPGAFCGEATEIFHEGLRVPPVKIKKAGKDVEEVWKLLLANVRTPRQNYGDLRAMIGCVDLGVDRIGEIVAQVWRDGLHADLRGPDGLCRAPHACGAVGVPRRQVRLRRRDRERRHRGQALHRRHRPLRPGRRDGRRLFSAARRRRGARSTPRSASPPAPSTTACCTSPTRRSPRTPAASGRSASSRRRASVTNVDYPGPLVAGNTETHPRLANIVIGAMAACVPERAMASESCTGTNFVFGGNHPDYDEYFACYDIMSGGWGGRFGHDGNDCVIAINGNCRFNPTEVFETRFPLRVEECAHGPRFRRRRQVARRPRLPPHAAGHPGADHRQPVQRPPRGQAVGAVRRRARRQWRHADQEGRQRATGRPCKELYGKVSRSKYANVTLRARRPHQADDARRRRLRRSQGARPRPRSSRTCARATSRPRRRRASYGKEIKGSA